MNESGNGAKMDLEIENAELETLNWKRIRDWELRNLNDDVCGEPSSQLPVNFYFFEFLYEKFHK